MSPEINGNPPSVTKRKKNRDKKSQKIDLNISPSDFLSPNQMGYSNSTLNNMGMSDLSAYFSVLNFTNGSEPLSLPTNPSNYPSYNQTRFNGFPNLNTQKNLFCPRNNNDVGEYMSLPINNIDPDMDENGKRRYSDPGLPNEDSDSSVASLEEKVINKLLSQVNVLKECNRTLTKEVMEMRVEINMLKQQVQQQNKRHFEHYEPGMLADVIREVRDAARVREDALLAKVKYIMEEKQLNMNHLQMFSEKNRSVDRIAKLEEQIKNLAINYRSEEQSNKPPIEDGHSARQVLELEREALELRRELQDTRAKKEEADQKVLQLNKKLASISKRSEAMASDASESGKTDSVDSASTTTTSSIIQGISTGVIPRVTLSGPVTDL